MRFLPRNSSLPKWVLQLNFCAAEFLGPVLELLVWGIYSSVPPSPRVTKNRLFYYATETKLWSCLKQEHRYENTMRTSAVGFRQFHYVTINSRPNRLLQNKSQTSAQRRYHALSGKSDLLFVWWLLPVICARSELQVKVTKGSAVIIY